MQDFKLEIDRENTKFKLTNYDGRKVSLAYNFNSTDGRLELQYYFKGNEYLLTTQALNWKKLPALQDDLHFTVDSFE